MYDLKFDDTYTGVRFTYGLRFRPLGKGHVPDGWIIWSDRDHKDFPHGTVDYPFELDKETALAFQMEPIWLW